MFISFLLPGVYRGAGPLFHWVMLAQMARFSPENVAFIGDSAYFDAEYVPFGETLQLGQIAFACPDRDRFARYRTHALAADLLHDLYGGDCSHLDVFQRLLTEPVPQLVQAIERALVEFDGQAIEAFLSWCNCPSLEQVASARGIPVIHNELGPLRAPLYRDTVYFDLRGVNGNTTPRTWTTAALREQLQGMVLPTADALRGRMVIDTTRAHEQLVDGGSPRYALGIALQVEDDSNVVAFNNGWNALRLIYFALTRERPDRVLVRSHPGGRFSYCGGLGVPDDSPDSLAFLARCERVLAINSSILAEAALWGVPFRAMGDAPFACLDTDALAEADAGERLLWLTAFFLGYLVPAELLFDLEYYRWRLAAPRTLAECIGRHWSVSANQADWPALGDGKGMPVSNTPTRSTATWTATLSLQRRLQHLSMELEQARNSLGKHAALEQEVARWRSEAEKVWENHEWLRGRVEELQSLTEQCRNVERDAQREAFDRKLGQFQEELAQTKACIQALGEQALIKAGRHQDAELALAETWRSELNALREVFAREQERLRESALRLGAECDALHAAAQESQQQLDAFRSRLQAAHSRRLSLWERLTGRLAESTGNN
jgi:hypothetical protein